MKTIVIGIVMMAYAASVLWAYAEVSEQEPHGRRMLASIATLIAVALASGWALEAVNG